MNASELADCIEFDAPIVGINKEAAIMLRQQQAEIEALKKEAALQRLSDFTQEAEKTLTDEEMDDVIHGVVAHAFIVAMETNSIDAPKLYRDIGRAILRKAQEK